MIYDIFPNGRWERQGKGGCEGEVRGGEGAGREGLRAQGRGRREAWDRMGACRREVEGLADGFVWVKQSCFPYVVFDNLINSKILKTEIQVEKST